MFCWRYQSSHLCILLIHWMFVCEAAASSQRRGASIFERINCNKNTHTEKTQTKQKNPERTNPQKPKRQTHRCPFLEKEHITNLEVPETCFHFPVMFHPHLCCWTVVWQFHWIFESSSVNIFKVYFYSWGWVGLFVCFPFFLFQLKKRQKCLASIISADECATVCICS